jgi:Protein of unknown function (DUF3553)
MQAYEPGSYVVHAKMPDLGSGEILSNEKGTLRIRFASGERAFMSEVVGPHLVVTAEAPARPTPAKRATKAKAKAKPKAKAESEAP